MGKNSQKEGQPDQIAEMKSRFQAELKKRDDALVAERRKAAETEQRSAIVEALGKAGTINPSRDVVHVSGVTKNAEGKFVRVTKDEFGADEEISLDDAVSVFLKSNPELKRASGHPGSGTPVGADAHLSITPSNDYMAQREKVLKGDVAIKF